MLFDERWRGTAPEKRDGYTGQLTRQLLADASGNAQRDPSATAAAEAAIGAYARAFSIADRDAEGACHDAVDPGAVGPDRPQHAAHRRVGALAGGGRR